MIDNDDIDAPEDFGAAPEEKPSLKEAWENNPMLKLAAIVLGVVVLGGGYMIFFPKDSEEAQHAKVRLPDATAKQIPGQQPVDDKYKEALEQVNKKNAAEQMRTGGSALPIPIATAKNGGLQVPEMPEKPKSDVLAEWRKAQEANRLKAAKDAVEEEGGAPTTDVVPMPTPIRPQQTMKQDPNASKRLTEQMRVIIAAQVPTLPRWVEITKEDSPYTELKKEEEEQRLKEASAASAQLMSSGGSGTTDATKDTARAIVPAGSIAYAQLLTELNSDIQGPVLAQILSGPFAGGRVIGKIEVKDEYMVINFTRIVKDTVSYKMSGVALDENTTLAGQATDVDHHYFVRVILPAAAKFIEGYGSAVAQTGTTVSQTDGGGQVAEQPTASPKQSIYKGIEESSKKLSDILDENAKRPVTVKIAKGTTMGVFFTESVTTKDAEK
jgi:intracellular multiplication protein IcmE